MNFKKVLSTSIASLTVLSTLSSSVSTKIYACPIESATNKEIYGVKIKDGNNISSVRFIYNLAADENIIINVVCRFNKLNQDNASTLADILNSDGVGKALKKGSKITYEELLADKDSIHDFYFTDADIANINKKGTTAEKVKGIIEVLNRGINGGVLGVCKSSRGIALDDTDLNSNTTQEQGSKVAPVIIANEVQIDEKSEDLPEIENAMQPLYEDDEKKQAFMLPFNGTKIGIKYASLDKDKKEKLESLFKDNEFISSLINKLETDETLKRLVNTEINYIDFQPFALDFITNKKNDEKVSWFINYIKQRIEQLNKPRVVNTLKPKITKDKLTKPQSTSKLTGNTLSDKHQSMDNSKIEITEDKPTDRQSMDDSKIEIKEAKSTTPKATDKNEIKSKINKEPSETPGLFKRIWNNIKKFLSNLPLIGKFFK